MKLVKESFGDTHYPKALQCVKVLREEAVKVINLINKGIPHFTSRVMIRLCNILIVVAAIIRKPQCNISSL